MGEQDQEARASMEEQWTAHKATPKVAYVASSANWGQGRAEPHNVLNMCFYLQKALPTPPNFHWECAQSPAAVGVQSKDISKL